MRFSKPLTTAILHQRYKRFLADVELIDTQQQLTAHCPNTGAMTGCAEPGMKVWLSHSDNHKRKYAYSWELAETSTGAMICINTQRANTVAGEALASGLIAAIGPLQQLKAEVGYGSDNRRIDWTGNDSQQRQVFIEVKSVTLADSAQPQQGWFPDTVSQRASDHLRSLIEMRQQGYRAVVLYVVLHSTVSRVAAAAHIDPNYAHWVSQAAAAGVEFYAIGCVISAAEIQAVTVLPVHLAK
jgi:sugar fermentation stimulation protein A